MHVEQCHPDGAVADVLLRGRFICITWILPRRVLHGSNCIDPYLPLRAWTSHEWLGSAFSRSAMRVCSWLVVLSCSATQSLRGDRSSSRSIFSRAPSLEFLAPVPLQSALLHCGELPEQVCNALLLARQVEAEGNNPLQDLLHCRHALFCHSELPEQVCHALLP